MKTRSLERKMKLGILGIVGIMSLVMVLTLFDMGRIRRDAGELSRRQIPSLQTTDAIRSSYRDLTASARRYAYDRREEDFERAEGILALLREEIGSAKKKAGGDPDAKALSGQLAIAELNIQTYGVLFTETRNIFADLEAEEARMGALQASYFQALDNLYDSLAGGGNRTKLFFVRNLYTRGFEALELKQEALSDRDPAKVESSIALMETAAGEIEGFIGGLSDRREIEWLYEVRTAALEYKDALAKLRLRWSDLEIIETRRGELESELYGVMAEIGTAAMASSEAAAETAEAAASRTTFYLLPGFLLILAIGYIFNRTMSRSVVKPIQALTAAAEALSEGDVSVEVGTGRSGDEIGALSEAFRNMTDTIRSQASAVESIARGNLDVALKPRSERDVLSQSINRMKENLQVLIGQLLHLKAEGDVGNHSERADAGNLEGSYAEILLGVNAILDYLGDPLNHLVKYFTMMAEGTLPETIDTGRYRGEFVGFMELVNRIRDNIYTINEEIRGLTRAADAGDLSRRIDAEKLPGEYGVILSGINRMLDTLIAPIQEASGVLQDLSEGRLSSRVRGDYKGDHGAIKEALNTMGEALEGYIGEISTILDEMASNNLDVSIEKTYKGDFAKIKASLNHIIEQFNLVMGEIGTAAHQVEAASGQVAGASQSLSQGAAEQAGSVQEISASMTQVGEQTRQNAANANKANEISHKARQAAEEGSRRMDEMLSAMEAINDASGNIAKIIKVIDEIAFQTNILALNAAVEAARAGEHGKGFAVVAEEVRNLAARSAAAARETTDMIDDSLVKVRRGTDLARDTSEALDRIVEGVGEAVEIVGEIAGASNEQATAIAEIGEGILQVSHVTQTNTATAEESASASEEMTSQAKALAELAARFRLRDGGEAPPPGRSQPLHKELEETFFTQAEPDLDIDLDDRDFGKY